MLYIFQEGRAYPNLIHRSTASSGITGASGRTCTTVFRGYYNSNSSRFRWLEQTLVVSVRASIYFQCASADITPQSGIRMRNSVIGGCNSQHSHRSSVITTSAVRSLRNLTDGTVSHMPAAPPLQCATLCFHIGHVLFFSTHNCNWLTRRFLVHALRKRLPVRHTARTRALFRIPTRAGTALSRSPVHGRRRHLGHSCPNAQRVVRFG